MPHSAVTSLISTIEGGTQALENSVIFTLRLCNVLEDFFNDIVTVSEYASFLRRKTTCCAFQGFRVNYLEKGIQRQILIKFANEWSLNLVRLWKNNTGVGRFSRYSENDLAFNYGKKVNIFSADVVIVEGTK